MSPETQRLIEFAFDELLLILIVYELTLKALNLARFTSLGQALARANLALSLVFLRAFLMHYWTWLDSREWMWVARVLVLITSTSVLWEMQLAFGGWRQLHRRAWRSAVDWARHLPPQTHDPDDEGY